MSGKGLTTLGMFVGSLIGGVIPMMFGANPFGFVSLLCSSIGAIVGIVIAYKLTNF